MRIKALDLLDSPPPNRDDEIDEISVPFGPAPAEQIVRPERTKASPEKCGIHGIYVPSSEGLSSPSWFKQDQSEKMTQRSLNKEQDFSFVCQSSSDPVTRAEQTRVGRPLQLQAPPATLIRCPTSGHKNSSHAINHSAGQDDRF